MAVVFILLDAFRWDYLDANVTPFLASCANDGFYIKRVMPSLGFCERSEILTGKTPDITGNFTAIGYAPNLSPYRDFSWLRWFSYIESVTPRNLLYRTYRSWLARLLRNRVVEMQPYHIPALMLPYFALTEDRVDHREPGAFRVKSVLDCLSEGGRKYYYESFTALNIRPNGSDDDRMDMAIAAARSGETYDLYLVFVSLPDVLGHKYGPDSDELKTGIRLLDKKLEMFVDMFSKLVPDINYIFLGDHGMLRVNTYLDLESVLIRTANKVNLKLEKDYLYFFDSTLLRIWCFSGKAQSVFEDVLTSNQYFSQNGFLINRIFAKALNIPYSDVRYGHIIWLANPHVLISPDFFHCRKLYGMHGYATSMSESMGMCIGYGPCFAPGFEEEKPLTYIKDIIWKGLDVE